MLNADKGTHMTRKLTGAGSEGRGRGEATKILFENVAMITKICMVIKKKNHYNRYQRNSDY